MALEPIKYDAHGAAIEAEWLKVVRGGDIEWLVISPEAGTNEYCPYAVGTGFREFLESVRDDGDTAVRYGIARVSPPGSDVQKVLLVGWCPDGAAMKMRASFAANFGTVANNLLKGYHVQVAARDEDDLDEKELLMKISNAAGARYSIQSSGSGASASASASASAAGTGSATGNVTKLSSSRPASEPKKEPVVKETQQQKQMQKKEEDDDDDWDEPAVRERDLEREPVAAAASTYKKIGRVDLQRTIAEESAKEDPRLVKTGVVGTRPPTTTAANVQDDDKVIRGFKTEKSPAQLWAERKARERGGANVSASASASSTGTGRADEKSADADADADVAHDVKDLKSRFEGLAVERDGASAAIGRVGVALPGMKGSDSGKDVEQDDDDDDDWGEEEKEPEEPEEPEEKSSPVPVSHEEEPEDEPEDESEPEEEASPAPPLPKRDEPKTRAVPPPPPRREEQRPEAEEEQKKEQPWAVAEYDYEAAEDNELTFAENDKIVNIEFVDDDWWLGELESGEKGLFPSNYVSLGH